jgi:hypothetical protein
MKFALFFGPMYGFVGVLLLYYASPLSIRYNTWTTRLRQRHPDLNPAPTPEWRERNTKIMTAYFRIAGLLLLLLCLLTLLPTIRSVPKPH